VIIESRLADWISAGVALYNANPLMIEQIFYDGSQTGGPSALAPALLTDSTQHWLPGEFAPKEYGTGFVRLGTHHFPIIDNTETTLTLDGDPTTVPPAEQELYQVVPPGVQGLATLLATKPVVVLTEFAQVPVKLPAITVRLERDAQGDMWIGESLEHLQIDSAQVDMRSQVMTGNYLLSMWTANRESALWMYAWAQNWLLNSLAIFARWGLYDVSMGGSDLDPQLQYLPERTYARHLLLTASRVERAVQVQNLEWVDRLCLRICAEYAQFNLTIPAMD